MSEVHCCESGLKITIPCGLCENAEALFRELANILDGERRLFAGDFIALGQVAQLQVDIAALQESIRRDGLTRTTEGNQTARRIEVSTLNQYRGHLTKLLAQFGLPLKGRQPVEQNDEYDPFDEFLTPEERG